MSSSVIPLNALQRWKNERCSPKATSPPPQSCMMSHCWEANGHLPESLKRLALNTPGPPRTVLRFLGPYRAGRALELRDAKGRGSSPLHAYRRGAAPPVAKPSPPPLYLVHGGGAGEKARQDDAPAFKDSEPSEVGEVQANCCLVSMA